MGWDDTPFNRADMVGFVETSGRPQPLDASMLARDLQQLLSGRRRLNLDLPSARRAGVLIVLYAKKGLPYILLTKRSQLVANHRGEISLPGGSADGGDESSMETALRETWEEVGIRVQGTQVLGGLDEIYTAKSNYLISPYVAYVESLDQIRPSEQEIVGVLEVPLGVLLDPANRREALREIDGAPRRIQFYAYDDQEIWGATARILDQFLEAVRETQKTTNS